MSVFFSIFRSCAFVLSVVILLVLPSCQDSGGEEPQFPSEKGRRTVLVYMAAQNSLGLYRHQAADSAEIMAGRRYIDDNDRLLVFVDDAHWPRLYRYTRSCKRPELVRQWDHEVCSTSPEQLREVVTWVKERYPSAEYGLVMWSHADGWLPPTNKDCTDVPPSSSVRPFSFGIDDGGYGMGSDKGPQMDVGEMAAALAVTGVRFKYIFFDACLMQNLEVAYALRHVTDCVVAAPMPIPAAGAYYENQLRHGLFAESPSAIVATYVSDVSSPSLSYQYDDYGITLSAVHTAALEPLAQVLRRALPHSAAAGRASASMEGVLNYQAYTRSYYYRPHNYDAAEALRRLLPESFHEEALLALNRAVISKGTTGRFWIGPNSWDYQQVNEKTYCGVSLFVPQNVYADNAGRTPHGNLNEAFRQMEWYDAAGWNATGW